MPTFTLKDMVVRMFIRNKQPASTLPYEEVEHMHDKYVPLNKKNIDKYVDINNQHTH